MSIEGAGHHFQNPLNANYPVFDLYPGVLYELSQNDIAVNFSPQYLLGYHGLPLPEGLYTFCFEVYESNTHRLVGDKQCTSVYVSLSDPPILLLPSKSEVINYTNPFQLLFQWAPRHMANTNAFFTEYEFSMVEIIDEQVNPEAAFYTSQPFYTKNINTPNLLYGIAEPPLVVGRKYAWRVKAKMLTKTQSEEPFRNHGYSEIFWFKLQGECPLPSKAEILGDPKTNKITLTWNQNISNVGSSILKYRKSGSLTWIELESDVPMVSLTGLDWNTTYEYQLGNRCSFQDDYAFGLLQNFKTLTQDTNQCIPRLPKQIENRNPLLKLKPGDTLVASGFNLKVTKVAGSNGIFSGEGRLALWVPTSTTQVNILVRFSNIGVNTDKELISGLIESIYDKGESSVDDIDEFIDGGNHVGDFHTGNTAIDYHVNIEIDPNSNAVVLYTSKDSIAEYSVTVKSLSGSESTIKTQKLPLIVKDAVGKIYKIEENGNIIPVGESGQKQIELLAGKEENALNELSVDKGIIKFIPHPLQKFSFDQFDSIYNKSIYFSEQYESLNDGKYRVANKLIQEGEMDKVLARIDFLDTEINVDSIHFITGKGVEMKRVKIDNKTFEVSLISGIEGDIQELFVVYNDKKKALKNPSQSKAEFVYVFGKLNIATYAQKNIKVNLVLMNERNIDLNLIKNKINHIYNKVSVHIALSKVNSIVNTLWDLDEDGQLNMQGAGDKNMLTQEMLLLNQQISKSDHYKDDEYYIFVFDTKPKLSSIEFENNQLLGEMLRSSQFGYVFSNNDNETSYILAHELGHGAFGLRHTFDEQYRYTYNELSNNLMDYSHGEELIKLQWDQIHDPGLVLSWLEDVEDGMLASKPNSGIKIMVSVKEGEQYKLMKSKGFVYISSEPEMPTLQIKVDDPTQKHKNVHVKLEVSYSRKVDKGPAMNQKTTFPENGKMINMPTYNGSTWNIDWRGIICGGIARLKVLNVTDDTLLSEFVFFIRGKNPTMSQVKAYISLKGYDKEYWFFSRIVRHESGSGSTDQSIAKQFNQPTSKKTYGEFNTIGLPIFGTPNGWGMMQLDNKDEINAGIAEVWNWKKNIDGGKKVIDNKMRQTIVDFKNSIKKIKSVYEFMPENVEAAEPQLEGTFTFSHIASNINGFDFLKKHFTVDESEKYKSLIDANIIKRYNGGQYYFSKMTDKNSAKWLINRYAKWKDKSGIVHFNYYVQDVCLENE
jgi:hypothetical protein